MNVVVLFYNHHTFFFVFDAVSLMLSYLRVVEMETDAKVFLPPPWSSCFFTLWSWLRLRPNRVVRRVVFENALDFYIGK
jgi:hypothetical protein